MLILVSALRSQLGRQGGEGERDNRAGAGEKKAVVHAFLPAFPYLACVSTPFSLTNLLGGKRGGSAI